MLPNLFALSTRARRRIFVLCVRRAFAAAFKMKCRGQIDYIPLIEMAQLTTSKRNRQNHDTCETHIIIAPPLVIIALPLDLNAANMRLESQDHNERPRILLSRPMISVTEFPSLTCPTDRSI